MKTKESEKTKTKTTTAVAVTKSTEVALAQNWEAMLDVVKGMCAKDATKEEFTVFCYQAKRTGLDPLARQIYLVSRYDSRSNKYVGTIQTGIDGFRVIAQRTGEYEGQTPPEWCGADGVWKSVWTDAKPPFAARVGVFRKGFRQACYGVALWSEYKQEYKDRSSGKYELTPMWKRMPAGQLLKCAEALALRRSFSSDLSGLYTHDEMGQADNTRTIEPEQVAVEEQSQEPQSEPKGEVVNDSEVDAKAAAESLKPNKSQLVELIERRYADIRANGYVPSESGEDAYQRRKDMTVPELEKMLKRITATWAKMGLDKA